MAIKERVPRTINVLVVDDDKKWAGSLEKQSKKLSKTKINIHSEYTFKNGLEFLNENKNIGAVFVDYKLDSNHDAFEFIDKSLELGISAPFFIISSSKKSEFFSQDNIENYLNHSIDGYIEKKGTSFKAIEHEVTKKYQFIFGKINSELKKYHDYQVHNADIIQNLSSEIYGLSDVIKSYQKIVDTVSFSRITTGIVERALLIAQASSIMRISPRVELSNNYKVLADNYDQKAKRFKNKLSQISTLNPEDYIPCEVGRNRFVKRLESINSVFNAGEEKADDFQHLLLKLVSTKFAKQNLKSLDNVFLSLAKKLADKGNMSDAVDFLYNLSNIHRENGSEEHAIKLEIVIGGFLYSYGKRNQASAYFHAAKKSAAASGDRKIEAMAKKCLAGIYVDSENNNLRKLIQ